MKEVEQTMKNYKIWTGKTCHLPSIPDGQMLIDHSVKKPACIGVLLRAASKRALSAKKAGTTVPSLKMILVQDLIF